MNRKIIGVTVGTPTSPKKMAQEINPVKTVNGNAPDANGNVNVMGVGGGSFISRTVTLSASGNGWDNQISPGKIFYRVAIEGVTADRTKSRVFYSIAPNADTSAMKAMEVEANRCWVRLVGQGYGFVMFEAINGEKPTIDITFDVFVVNVEIVEGVTTASYNDTNGDLLITRGSGVATSYNTENGELTILHDAATHNEETGELTI